MNQVIKRSGKEVSFDKSKIENAIINANLSVDDKKFQLKPAQIERITNNVIVKCEELGRAVHVEEIQDMVEEEIMRNNAYRVAKNYITYRYRHDLMRKSNTTDALEIWSLCGWVKIT